MEKGEQMMTVGKQEEEAGKSTLGYREKDKEGNVRVEECAKRLEAERRERKLTTLREKAE